MTTPTRLIYNYKVVNMSETGDGRINVSLGQLSDTPESASSMSMTGVLGTSNVLLDRQTARMMFPGDIFVVTFEAKVP